MDCDNRVVSALGGRNATVVLFKVARKARRGQRLQPAFLGAGMLERRLIALVAQPHSGCSEFLLPPRPFAFFTGSVDAPRIWMCNPPSRLLRLSFPNDEIHLTQRELDIMSVLWELGEATVTEVRDRGDSTTWPIRASPE